MSVFKCKCVSVSVEVSVFKGFSGRTLRNAFGKKHKIVISLFLVPSSKARSPARSVLPVCFTAFTGGVTLFYLLRSQATAFTQ